MALITLILALVLDRALRHLHDLRDLTWFEHYTRAACRLLASEHAGLNLFLALALPLAGVGLLQVMLDDALLGLPAFVFGLTALLYSLGPTCLYGEIEAYLDARSLGDDDEALHYAGSLTERAASMAPDQQTSDVTRAIFLLAAERIYNVLFWFVVLGPVGAVCYRLLSSVAGRDLEKPEVAPLARRLQALMAWLPSRMLALGYALTGHFDGAVHAYQVRPQESELNRANHDILVATGLGALHGQDILDDISRVQAARDLVRRSILVWVAVLALLTLGGWFS